MPFHGFFLFRLSIQQQLEVHVAVFIVGDAKAEALVESDHLAPGLSGLEDNTLETARFGFRAQGGEDAAAEALTAGGGGHRHAHHLGAIGRARHERPATDHLALFFGDNEIRFLVG